MRFLRRCFIYILCFGFLHLTAIPAAQAQFSGENLSDVRVDDIPQAQLEAYYDRFKRSGLTEEQAFQLLAQRKLPASEIQKLQGRLRQIDNQGGSGSAVRSSNEPSAQVASARPNQSTTAAEPAILLDSLEREIYGMEIFTQPGLSFQPEVQIATPASYIVGPGDELIINVYGLSEANYTLVVNKDGAVTIPNVGNVAVAGLSIEQAKAKIIGRLRGTAYTAIGSGQTKVDIGLGRLRSIKITIIGQARKPGVYQVSGASSVFNALYNAGGPNRNGSFRNIAVLRNGVVRARIDLYEFLNGGDLSANIRLQENDVVRIPFYESRIRLSGEFKRPGLFELREGEKLPQIIRFAGGFTDSAYRGRLRITQLNNVERQLKTLASADVAAYLPQPGDEVFASKILSRYANRLVVEGGFTRPGDYEFQPGMTLKQLVQQADGLRPEAFGNRISLTRLNDDQSSTISSYTYAQIMNTEAGNVSLQKNDRLFVPIITDLRDDPIVEVNGEVRRPGRYAYRQGISIQDLITQAGGFTEAGTGKNIEIGRRITSADSGRNTLRVADVISVDIERDLGRANGQVTLQPFDILIVRNNPGYFTQRTVRIEGEVSLNGLYTIANREERISDLIARAGGFTALADAKSVSLRRRNAFDQDSLRLLAASKQLSSLRRSSANLDVQETADSLSQFQYDQVAIDLEEILKRPKSSIDIILQEGDVIYVPKRDQAVKVRGEVLLPTQVAFEPGKNLKFYVNRAGGFTNRAIRRQAFAISANGNGKTIKRFLFIRNYPLIQAGDDIYVPQKKERTNEGLSATTVVGLASAVASLAGVVIAIVNITNN